MTAEQFLIKNHFTMEDRNRINFVATLQMRLMKHLIDQNDVRVRVYLLAIRVFWPERSEIPISLNLIKKAISFLESRGWHMHLVDDHSKGIGRYITRSR